MSCRRALEWLAVYAGLLLGLSGAALVAAVLDDFGVPSAVRLAITAVLGLSGFAASGVALTALAHRLVVEPATEESRAPAGRTYVLDTSAIIDGRIADVMETRIFDNPLVVPQFVIRELQSIADSSDRLKRARGRRGLDILNRLRTARHNPLQIEERESNELGERPVDEKLVLLAQRIGGAVVTGDFNLNKVARLHGVDVINLNDVAAALRPVYLPGEALEVHLVKPGEEPGQGVGYLDDGTMIVVEQGRERINQTVSITVTSVLQTSAGRMIFGR